MPEDVFVGQEKIGFELFAAVEDERKIICKGQSIRVYHPDTPENPPHYEHHDIDSLGESTVPAGYVVRVIGGYVKYM